MIELAADFDELDAAIGEEFYSFGDIPEMNPLLDMMIVQAQIEGLAIATSDSRIGLWGRGGMVTLYGTRVALTVTVYGQRGCSEKPGTVSIDRCYNDV